MPMLILIKATSRIISWLPHSVLKLICRILGALVYHISSKRRTTALRNLHHCFPNKGERQRREILKEHCRRLIEMALFVIGNPSFSEERISGMFDASSEADRLVFDEILSNHPSVLLIPHFTLAELTNASPIKFPSLEGKAGVIFRPLKDPKVNQWVTNSRSRHGVELLSRKSGYSQAMKRLEKGEVVGLLFDQNASGKGSIIHFFNRIASSSELPGLLAHKHNANCYIVYPERTGFFKARIRAKRIEKGTQPIHLTIAANNWLEQYLGASDDQCADWLWLHDRWGSQQNPKRRFQIRSKRNRLKTEADFRENDQVKAVTPVWVYLPCHESNFLDLPEILNSVKIARPDYSIRLVGPHSHETIQKYFCGLAESFVPCDDNIGQIDTITKISLEYPDLWINLANSKNSLLFSQASQAHQRFGIETVRNAKKYLTHLGPPPNESWLPFFESFGLKPVESDTASDTSKSK